MVISLTIKQLNGNSSILPVDENSKIQNLLDTVASKQGIPDPKSLRLVWNGKALNDMDMKINSFGIKDGDIVYSIIHLKG